MAKLLLLQSSVSHDTSEIILIYWFGAQETFLIIIVESSCAADFCENHETCFFFSISGKNSINLK